MLAASCGARTSKARPRRSTVRREREEGAAPLFSRHQRGQAFDVSGRFELDSETAIGRLDPASHVVENGSPLGQPAAERARFERAGERDIDRLRTEQHR